MKPLILVGGGGHCKSVIEAAESMGLAIGGILDLLENVGGRILGYRLSVPMTTFPVWSPILIL